MINIFTLLGSVLGQLVFGFLADYYGRTRLYGIELVLVIVSTIGVATSSHGYGDMSFLGLFVWWRFVMGVGTPLLQHQILAAKADHTSFP
jgi:PHS family inorganic phosphate transporter-like MFS transporter